jgi:deoxyribose-phosphate aldolase
VPVAVEALAGAPVLVATVANFPQARAIRRRPPPRPLPAVAAGADEVDVVAPWRRALPRIPEAVAELVGACRVSALDRILKVILETGSHPDPASTRAMADAALAAGADFLKTSTGKHGPAPRPKRRACCSKPSATPERAASRSRAGSAPPSRREATSPSPTRSWARVGDARDVPHRRELAARRPARGAMSAPAKELIRAVVSEELR